VPADVFPAHGFARSAPWQVRDANLASDGTVWLTLELPRAAMPAALWPHVTALELAVGLGSGLQLRLTTRNEDTHAVVLGEALHTYFRISDIAAVALQGLDGATYWDTVGSVERKVQHGAIRFAAETDRVYVDSEAACRIDDPGFGRCIHIRKRGSRSTVVWNPWIAKALRMGDLGQPDGWREMLCVESANAWDNRIVLQPGETHVMEVDYRVEALPA
ncbi:MAG TPA: D-hexose-6-phosphate mutarotase, partial [Rhodocyclaceae bacterium]|nr:D-hexose-6-phosphate mutarotase [Rhodocyclaceae bacterium]